MLSGVVEILMQLYPVLHAVCIHQSVATSWQKSTSLLWDSLVEYDFGTYLDSLSE